MRVSLPLRDPTVTRVRLLHTDVGRVTKQFDFLYILTRAKGNFYHDGTEKVYAVRFVFRYRIKKAIIALLLGDYILETGSNLHELIYTYISSILT